jgi:hypothetical protein
LRIVSVDLVPEEIASREMIGWLEGQPVYSVETTGGYSMVLALRSNGRLDPIGVGPHPGVAKGIAKKREPKLIFSQLAKADMDVDSNGRIFQRYEEFTVHFRATRGF